jgi:hypothetical protein
LKISEQPGGAGRGGAGEIRNDLLEFFRREAIEQEMRDKQVERPPLGLPGQDVRANEIHAPRIQSVLPQSLPRGQQHSIAGIYRGDARARELCSAFGKKSTIPFTNDQDILRIGNLIQKRGATVL